MSGFPDNVIRLADHRRADPEPEWPSEPIVSGRHLRVVRQDATVFRLDVFLSRARVVMAEADATASAEIIPLHERQPA